MVKETSSFSLIILLFGMLVAFWLISSYQTPLQRPILKNTQFDQAYIAQTPFIFLHDRKIGREEYKSSIIISECDMFQTALEPSKASLNNLHITLYVTHQQDCSDPDKKLVVPIEVTYTPTYDNTDSPQVTEVRINDANVPFSIVESQKKS